MTIAPARFLGLLLAAVAVPVFAVPPQVTLAQGKLAGTHEGTISVFRGIPFAGDTGGSHRWRPPTPAPHWQGVRDASHFGPICPQPSRHDGHDNAQLQHFTMSENCLNLTVYTPSLHPRKALPVMVWVHGGGGRFGSGSFYDGSRLAHRGVVVVTLNYRLGLLGQFAYPGLNAKHPDAPRGNYNLMDVLAGLQWVQANISAFGGDPHAVTLFGQSQGSMIVTTLMASPYSKGLFQRAIAESGVVLQLGRARYLTRSLPYDPSLESTGVTMARALLPKDKPASPAQLRDLTWQAIIKYQAKALPPDAMPPVLDGKLLPEPVGQRFAEGKQLAIPLLIGTNSWEQSLFVHFHLPEQQILGRVPKAELHALYPGMTGQPLVDQWLVDMNFNAPARWLADASAKLGQPVWVYQFDHLSPAARKAKQPGAAHADELRYLFNMHSSVHPGFVHAQKAAANSQEQRMTALMVGYWTQFAKTGDPNGPDLPKWPRWAAGGDGVTQLLNIPVRQQAGLMKQRMQYQFNRFDKTLQAAQVH